MWEDWLVEFFAYKEEFVFIMMPKTTNVLNPATQDETTIGWKTTTRPNHGVAWPISQTCASWVNFTYPAFPWFTATLESGIRTVLEGLI